MPAVKGQRGSAGQLGSAGQPRGSAGQPGSEVSGGQRSAGVSRSARVGRSAGVRGLRGSAGQLGGERGGPGNRTAWAEIAGVRDLMPVGQMIRRPSTEMRTETKAAGRRRKAPKHGKQNNGKVDSIIYVHYGIEVGN